MAAIRSSGNRDTELKLVALFKIHGITGWRRKQRVFGKPDFIFRRQKVAVFVDGCFWHGCPKHCRKPSTNRFYWLSKLRRNQERDIVVKRALSKTGWIVLRLWEHDLKNGPRTAQRITKSLNRNLTRLHLSNR
jgi:DNA mismatch endonuclease (patch repair protein)